MIFFLKHLECESISSVHPFALDHWTSSLTWAYLVCVLVYSLSCYLQSWRKWRCNIVFTGVQGLRAREYLRGLCHIVYKVSFACSQETHKAFDWSCPSGGLFWHLYMWWIIAWKYLPEWVKDCFPQQIFYGPRENISKCEWKNKSTVLVLT